MEVVKNPNNNLKAEIKFVEIEFEDLGKKDYIKNGLLNNFVNSILKNFTKINTLWNICIRISGFFCLLSKSPFLIALWFMIFILLNLSI